MSLASLDVQLDPVTVLVGRSGTGKSNFLRAFRFVREFLRRLDVNAAANELGGWPVMVPATIGGPCAIEFELFFQLPDAGDEFSYTLVFYRASRQVAPVLVCERFSVGSRPIINRGEITGQQGLQPQQPELATKPDDQNAVIAYEALSKELGCYDFPSQVLQAPGDNREKGFADAGQNFIVALSQIRADRFHLKYWGEMVGSLKKLNPTLELLNLDRPPTKVQVVHRFKGDERLSLDLSQESEGFRRFFAHLIALYQAPSKLFLTFEEPEKGIYPGALAVLADELNAAAASGRGQILLASHSPQLLDSFSPEQIRVVDMRGHSTTIGPLAREQLDSVRERLMTAGELLTVDPARIQAAVI